VDLSQRAAGGLDAILRLLGGPGSGGAGGAGAAEFGAPLDNDLRRAVEVLLRREEGTGNPQESAALARTQDAKDAAVFLLSAVGRRHEAWERRQQADAEGVRALAAEREQRLRLDGQEAVRQALQEARAAHRAQLEEATAAARTAAQAEAQAEVEALRAAAALGEAAQGENTALRRMLAATDARLRQLEADTEARAAEAEQTGRLAGRAEAAAEGAADTEALRQRWRREWEASLSVRIEREAAALRAEHQQEVDAAVFRALSEARTAFSVEKAEEIAVAVERREQRMQELMAGDRAEQHRMHAERMAALERELMQARTAASAAHRDAAMALDCLRAEHDEALERLHADHRLQLDSAVQATRAAALAEGDSRARMAMTAAMGRQRGEAEAAGAERMRAALEPQLRAAQEQLLQAEQDFRARLVEELVGCKAEWETRKQALEAAHAAARLQWEEERRKTDAVAATNFAAAESIASEREASLRAEIEQLRATLAAGDAAAVEARAASADLEGQRKAVAAEVELLQIRLADAAAALEAEQAAHQAEMQRMQAAAAEAGQAAAAEAEKLSAMLLASCTDYEAKLLAEKAAAQNDTAVAVAEATAAEAARQARVWDEKLEALAHARDIEVADLTAELAALKDQQDADMKALMMLHASLETQETRHSAALAGLRAQLESSAQEHEALVAAFEEKIQGLAQKHSTEESALSTQLQSTKQALVESTARFTSELDSLKIAREAEVHMMKELHAMELQMQEKQLRGQFAQEQAEADKLRASVQHAADDTREMLAKKMAELSQASAQVAEMEARFQDSQRRIQELEKSLDDMQESMAAANAAHKQEIDRLLGELKLFSEGEMDSLRGAHRAEVEAWRQREGALREELIKAIANSDNLQQRLDEQDIALQEAIEVSRQREGAQRTALSAAQENAARMRSDFEARLAEQARVLATGQHESAVVCEDLLKRLAAAVDEHKSCAEREAAFRQELASWKTACETALKERLAEQERRQEAEAREKNATDSSEKKLKEVDAALQDKLRKLQEAKVVHAELQGKYESNYKRLSELVDDLTATKTSLRERLEELGRAKAEILGLQRAKQDEAEKGANAQRKFDRNLAEKDAEIGRLRQQVSEEQKTLQIEKERLATEIVGQEHEAQSLRSEIKFLHAQANDAAAGHAKEKSALLDSVRGLEAALSGEQRHGAELQSKILALEIAMSEEAQHIQDAKDAADRAARAAIDDERKKWQLVIDSMEQAAVSEKTASLADLEEELSMAKRGYEDDVAAMRRRFEEEVAGLKSMHEAVESGLKRAAEEHVQAVVSSAVEQETLRLRDLHDKEFSAIIVRHSEEMQTLLQSRDTATAHLSGLVEQKQAEIVRFHAGMEAAQAQALHVRNQLVEWEAAFEDAIQSIRAFHPDISITRQSLGSTFRQVLATFNSIKARLEADLIASQNEVSLAHDAAKASKTRFEIERDVLLDSNKAVKESASAAELRFKAERDILAAEKHSLEQRLCEKQGHSAEVDVVSRRLSQCESRLAETETKLVSSQKDVDSLQEALARVNALYDDLTRTNASLESKTAERENDLLLFRQTVFGEMSATFPSAMEGYSLSSLSTVEGLRNTMRRFHEEVRNVVSREMQRANAGMDERVEAAVQAAVSACRIEAEGAIHDIKRDLEKRDGEARNALIADYEQKLDAVRTQMNEALDAELSARAEEQERSHRTLVSTLQAQIDGLERQWQHEKHTLEMQHSAALQELRQKHADEKAALQSEISMARGDTKTYEGKLLQQARNAKAEYEASLQAQKSLADALETELEREKKEHRALDNDLSRVRTELESLRLRQKRELSEAIQEERRIRTLATEESAHDAALKERATWMDSLSSLCLSLEHASRTVQRTLLVQDGGRSKEDRSPGLNTSSQSFSLLDNSFASRSLAVERFSSAELFDKTLAYFAAALQKIGSNTNNDSSIRLDASSISDLREWNLSSMQVSSDLVAVLRRLKAAFSIVLSSVKSAASEREKALQALACADLQQSERTRAMLEEQAASLSTSLLEAQQEITRLKDVVGLAEAKVKELQQDAAMPGRQSTSDSIRGILGNSNGINAVNTSAISEVGEGKTPRRPSWANSASSGAGSSVANGVGVRRMSLEEEMPADSLLGPSLTSASGPRGTLPWATGAANKTRRLSYDRSAAASEARILELSQSLMEKDALLLQARKEISALSEKQHQMSLAAASLFGKPPQPHTPEKKRHGGNHSDGGSSTRHSPGTPHTLSREYHALASLIRAAAQAVDAELTACKREDARAVMANSSVASPGSVSQSGRGIGDSSAYDDVLPSTSADETLGKDTVDLSFGGYGSAPGVDSTLLHEMVPRDAGEALVRPSAAVSIATMAIPSVLTVEDLSSRMHALQALCLQLIEVVRATRRSVARRLRDKDQLIATLQRERVTYEVMLDQVRRRIPPSINQ
jgi:hypothetical protein